MLLLIVANSIGELHYHALVPPLSAGTQNLPVKPAAKDETLTISLKTHGRNKKEQQHHTLDSCDSTALI